VFSFQLVTEQERPKEELTEAREFSMKNGKRKALIIGISKYDHTNKFRDLDFCENDANEVYKVLKDQGYDIPENAMLVGKVEWAKMREEIIKFFGDKTLRPEDTLFFYFSGHGYLDKGTSHTYLSTSEIDPAWPKMRGVPLDELTANINDSNSERIVAVLDCCYSGALEVGGKGGGGEDYESAKSEKGEEIASLAEVNMRKTVERLIKSGHGKCVLASSLEEQRSFGMKDQPYSTFTYFLIQGLKGGGGESVDANGYVTPELLGSYVNKKMYELPTVKQNPIRKIEVTGLLILAYHPKLAKRQQPQRDYLLQLLTEGRVDEFNEIRRKDNFSTLNFYKVDLSKRDLSHADLRNCDFTFANLKKAKLQKAILIKASLLEADLSDGADLQHADLSEADLSKAKIIGANLSHANLTKAKLFEADLFYADLSLADLSNAFFCSADLSNAKLSGAYVPFASPDFSKAKLPRSDLSDAKISGANLSEADLSEADLFYTDLSNANLSYSNLSGANLSGANLSGANLSKAKLESSIIIAGKFDDKIERGNLCEDADFDNAIIDNESLRRYFHNNNAKNLPPAAKDKKELRETLEKRGYAPEKFNRWVSSSSIPYTFK
jgi:uncharacterized protein YjbI with pentapeptide repeats